MRPPIAAFLLFMFPLASTADQGPKWSDRPLSLIATKEDRYYSYQLYQTSVSNKKWDLFLLIKNTGVKVMKMKGDFKPVVSIKDSNDEKLYVTKVSEVSISNQDVGIIHISALATKDSASKFTLEVSWEEILNIAVEGIVPLLDE